MLNTDPLMSLADAFLNEPYRTDYVSGDVREVWIVLRSDVVDGVPRSADLALFENVGAGTASDPFSGNKRLGPSMSAGLSLDRTELVVTQVGPVNFTLADSVVIFGVVGQDSDLVDDVEKFNRTFQATKLSDRAFRIALSSVPEALDPNAPVQAGKLGIAAGGTLAHGASLAEFMTVTLNASGSHGLSEGDYVRIDLVSLTGAATKWFNGVFKVESVGSTSSFTFKLTRRTAPPAGADGEAVNFANVQNPTPVHLNWPVVKVDTSPTNHGLIGGAVVAFSGSTNPDADGEFVVLTAANSQAFYYASLGGAGTPPMPANRIKCAEVIYLLDEILRSLSPYTVVHLGPGLFETRGFDVIRQSFNWSIQPGQRIQGFGMGVTTLKLVHVTPFWPNPQVVWAIGSNPSTAPFWYNIDDAEVLDLTVDCNMRAHARQRVATSAIVLAGSHVRIRRVRVIDYGTQVPFIECFPLAVAAADPRSQFTERINARIEDCVIEAPSIHGLYNDSCLILFAGDDPDTGIVGYHRGCAIRNNYVNNECVDNPVSIESVKYESGAWTVTTRAPHGLKHGGWAVISGVQDHSGVMDRYGNSLHFNGSFEVLNATSTKFQIKPANPAGVLSTALAGTGSMWVGRFSSQRISVKRIERDDTYDLTGTTAILTTYGPHYRRPGEWIEIVSSSAGKLTGAELPYYGRFEVLDVEQPSLTETNPSRLTYRMYTRPGRAVVADGTDSPPVDFFLDFPYLGKSSVGFSSDGGSEAVAEGNRIFNTRIGGAYHDFGLTTDQTDRNNYYHDVLSGPYQNIDGVQNTGSGLLRQVKEFLPPSGTTVTVRTHKDHGIEPGQAVRIATNNVKPSDDFYYRVVSVVKQDLDAIPPVEASFTFTFDPKEVLPPANPKPWFAVLWQVRLAARENNVIELGDASHQNAPSAGSHAIAFNAVDHGKGKRIFQSVLVRDNIVAPGPSSLASRSYAVTVNDAERAIVDGNTIGVARKDAVIVQISGPLFFSENRTPAGIIVEPTIGTSGNEVLPEALNARVKDALILSL